MSAEDVTIVNTYWMTHRSRMNGSVDATINPTQGQASRRFGSKLILLHGCLRIIYDLYFHPLKVWRLIRKIGIKLSLFGTERGLFEDEENADDAFVSLSAKEFRLNQMLNTNRFSKVPKPKGPLTKLKFWAKETDWIPHPMEVMISTSQVRGLREPPDTGKYLDLPHSSFRRKIQ